MLISKAGQQHMRWIVCTMICVIIGWSMMRRDHSAKESRLVPAEGEGQAVGQRNSIMRLQMENSENTHSPAHITTLEEAKQEISRLLEFQKRAYYFLGVFCNYDIREPLLSANSAAKALQADISQQHLDFLENMFDAHERIDRISKVVQHAVRAEEGGIKRFEFLKAGYPFETLDINLVLKEIIPQIKERIERQNYQYARVDEKWEPAQVKIRLANDLPAAQCNSSMLAEVLSDLVWFIMDTQSRKMEVSVITDFDEQWVKIIFRCSSSDPHRYVFALKEFERFNVETTFLGFHPASLFLYNSWQTLKMYGGSLGFSVQDNTEIRKPSLMEATVYLKR